MKKVFLDIGIILVTIILLLFVLYFLCGSLEMHPTQEQENKVKIVSLIMICISLIIDGVLIKKRIKLKNKN